MGPTVAPLSRCRVYRTSATVTLLILAVAFGKTTAQTQTGPDAVERLRWILRSTTPGPAERDASLKECAGGLRGLSELRRALLLSEWRQSGSLGAIGQVDALNRSLLTERFLREVRTAFQHGDSVTASVVVGMVDETAAALKMQGEGAGLVRPLAPDLAALTQRVDTRLRAAAARGLGQIEADASVAVPALVNLLQAPEPALRRAAIDGLTELLDGIGAALSRSDGPRTGSPERAEKLRVAATVLLAVGRALDDPSPENRRTAAFTVGKAAARTALMISTPPSSDPMQTTEGKQAWWRAIQAERAEVRPLVAALHEQGMALVRAIRSGDREDRLATVQALEEIANVRLRWLRETAGIGPADDLLLDVFQVGLTALAEATADKDMGVRRSAIEVLESVGTAAAPAAPALAAALTDSDRFVRWSAVRALRNIGPAAARCATPGLALLLEDPDLDVRLAAAAALEQFAPPHGQTSEIRPVSYIPVRLSPFARTALPPLLRSLRSEDAEVRTAAMRTLRGLGAEARPAVPALREALADDNQHIRQAAVETLGAVGPSAREAVEDLRRMTQDGDAEVRRAASEALLNILRGPGG